MSATTPSIDDAPPLRPRARACAACGALQLGAAIGSHQALHCAVCDSTLERRAGRSLEVAFACALATLLLLIAANTQTFLTTAVFGVSRQSQLLSSVTGIVGEGYPELGFAIGLFAIVFPLLHFGLLVAALATLRLGRRPHWLGRVLRAALSLRTWAMADVFLVGLVVSVARMRGELSVEIDAGAWCFGLAAVSGLFVRWTLDAPTVWTAIRPDAPAASLSTAAISCRHCEWLAPAHAEGRSCPRCRAVLHARKPGAAAICGALALAAALLYLPANLYTMATLPIGLTPTSYTVIQGVFDLFGAKLYALAALVLTASFAIPLAKLVGLAWCVDSVRRGSTRRLVAKTRLFAVIEELGRWSMIDVFVIACFVPVTQYNALVRGSAGPAAPAFAAVVILTTLAARSFDSRLLWDAARRGGTR